MSTGSIRFGVLAASLAVSLCAATTTHAQVPRQILDSLFAGMHATNGPGCVVAFDSAGQRRWLTAFGLRDLERGGRNDSTTVFDAGSVSKQVTAAAVILLARQGRLSLDDDVRRWIPELPDFGATTLRMLLAHESGWRDWRNLTEMGRWTSETAAWTNGDVLALLARQRGVNFAPGTEYSYSNTNYVLAAIVVERVTGQSFRSFTTREIFHPLGMHGTLWRDAPGEVIPHRALGYSPQDNGAFRLDTPIETVVGPSGLLITMPDLMRWLQNLDGETVGGRGFRDDMERPGVLSSGRVTAYAMGLEISTVGGERVVSHAGWTGGYVAYAARMPRRRLSLGVLCNGSAINTEDIGPVLLARLAHVTPPQPDTRPVLGDSATTGPPARLAGMYRNQRTGQVVTVRAFERGVAINTWNGFVTAGAFAYRSVDGARELRTADDGAMSATSFTIGKADGDSIVYRRIDGTRAIPAQFEAFTGAYRNDETDATITLTQVQNTLVAQRGGTVRDALEPMFLDGFRAPSTSWVLTFQRTPDGTVTGFDLSLPRTRRLTFARIH